MNAIDSSLSNSQPINSPPQPKARHPLISHVLSKIEVHKRDAASLDTHSIAELSDHDPFDLLDRGDIEYYPIDATPAPATPTALPLAQSGFVRKIEDAAASAFNWWVQKFSHEPIETYGVGNISIPNNLKRAAYKAHDLVRGVFIPDHRTLIESYTQLTPTLDDQVERTKHFKPHLSQVEPLSLTASTAAENTSIMTQSGILDAEEKQITKHLKEKTTLFCTLAVFHGKILGCEVDKPLTFYCQFLNAPDPFAAYVETLDGIGQILAKILLPIIHFFLNIIFYFYEDANSFHSFLSTLRLSLQETCFDNEQMLVDACDFAYKLNNIVTQFVSGDASALSFNQFLKERLEADLERSQTPKDKLYRNTHAWLVNHVGIRSNIPIIGGFVDSILKDSLHSALDQLGFLENVLSFSLGTTTPTNHFSFVMLQALTKQLETWTEALKTRKPTEETSSSLSPRAREAFFITTRREELLKVLFQRIARYLPFESAKMEDIPQLLKAQQNPHKHQKEILAGLEQLFVEMGSLLFEQLKSKEQQQALWIEVLKVASSLFEDFEEPSEEQCAQTYYQAKVAVHELLQAALNLYFTDEYMKTEKKREIEKARKCILSLKHDVHEHVEILNAITVRLQQNPNTRSIEKFLYHFSKEIKECFSLLFNYLYYTYDTADQSILVPMPWQTRRSFLLGMHTIRSMIEKLDEHSKSLHAISTLDQLHCQLLEMTQALFPSETKASNDEILPNRTLAIFNSYFSRVMQLLDQFEVCELMGLINKDLRHKIGGIQLAIRNTSLEIKDETEDTDIVNRGISLLQNNLSSLSIIDSKLIEIKSLNLSLHTSQNLLDQIEPLNSAFKDMKTLIDILRGNLTDLEREGVIATLQSLHHSIFELLSLWESDEKLGILLELQELNLTLENLETDAGRSNVWYSLTNSERALNLAHANIILTKHKIATHEREIRSLFEQIILNMTTATVDTSGLQNLDEIMMNPKDSVSQLLRLHEDEIKKIKEERSDLRLQLASLIHSLVQFLEQQHMENREEMQAMISSIFAAISTISTRNQSFKEPQYVDWFLGAGIMKEWEKQAVYSRVQDYAIKTLNSMINPTHFEQLVLRFIAVRL